MKYYWHILLNKNSSTKRLISTGSMTLAIGLSIFAVTMFRSQEPAPPAAVMLEAIEDAEVDDSKTPLGLSRERKDFEKAFDILASAASIDADLAEYLERVEKRVTGEAIAPEKGSGVRVVKSSGKLHQAAGQNIKAAGASEVSQKKGFWATLKDLVASGMTAESVSPASDDTQHAQADSSSSAKVQAVTDSRSTAASRLTVDDVMFEKNAAIERWVDYFTNGRGRKTMDIGIERSSQYLEMSRAEFRRLGVPEDLVWLAFVESVWHPGAMSPAAAGGIWQFIPKTATEYGLSVTSGYDERFDPVKQTRVAATYLKDLHTIFGDWALAMAAYNCGEPRVMSAIVKNGRANFWDLYDKALLPDETRNYVPKILAAIEVARSAESYGFTTDFDIEMDFAGR